MYARVMWLQRTRESWQVVFFIAAGVYTVGGIISCILTSGTIQPWALDNRMKPIELDISAITSEREVAESVDQHDSVDHFALVRPSSQSNGELSTVDRGSTDDVRITHL